MTPQSWTDAYNAANEAGLIPNVPPTTVNGQGVVSYPNGYNPLSNDVCNAYAGCRIPGDTYNAPDGSIGIGYVISHCPLLQKALILKLVFSFCRFDDGPVSYVRTFLWTFF
jgi:hypothetical protein